jgi:hypothetical protein
LARAGVDVSTDDVRRGYVGSMTIRSAFTAMPFELFESGEVSDSDDLRARLADRVRLTRFMLDLARQTLPDVLA